MSYHFVCSCGKCKKKSNEITLDYIRLQKGQHWYAKDCPELPKDFVEKTEAVGGYIIKLEGDF